MSRNPDPRQTDMFASLDATLLPVTVALDRPRWQPGTAIETFKTHLQAFHETAVAGDRRAQDDVLLGLNRFVREVADDSLHWRRHYRDGSDSSHTTRIWLLQSTHHTRGQDLILGQAFDFPVIIDGEQVRLICVGLASSRVTVSKAGEPDRYYWAGLGTTGFHRLQGRTPLEYIVSRCVPSSAT